MSTSTSGAKLGAGAVAGTPTNPAIARARAYFASDTRRTIQTVLGLIWLLDGILQFQSFMYGNGFIQVINGLTAGQPSWVAQSVHWGATALHSDQALFNTLFALVQVAIGVGLLYRPTVKPAIAVSFVWALVVWWFGEAFGMLFMEMANALTGAPGAVVLYAIIGAIVWPNGRPGGLLGVTGARAVWAGLWILMGGLWLLEVNASANATTGAINAAPAGPPWLNFIQNSFADAAKGDGLIIAFVLAALSVAIGVAVAVNWNPKVFLWIAIVLNLLYWVVGQGFGGILAGGATDPNAGPLFVLLAVAMYSLIPYPSGTEEPVRRQFDAQPAGVNG